MKPNNRGELQIGDRVVLCESSVTMEGAVVAVLEDGYVRVRWTDSGIATTHRRYALQPGWRTPGWRRYAECP